MTPENTQNKWRVEIDYSITVEKFLLTQTKLFINTLDSRDKNTTNPMFLKSLVNEISDYLSKYIMRGKNTNRNGATKEIKEILCEIDEEIGIGLKAGIGRGKNAEDAAYMADIGLEEIRDRNNEPWTWVVEKLE